MSAFFPWMRRIARRPSQGDCPTSGVKGASQARRFAECIRLCRDPVTDEFIEHAARERQRYLNSVAAGR